jgi:D-inositol-3-phosphate glycosyltransferase
MISFIWSSPDTLAPGLGGTEAFTLGQCRELNRRRIENQVVTFGRGEKDGREFSPDISFVSYKTTADMPRLEDDVVLVTEPAAIRTTKPASVMLHSPPRIGQSGLSYRHAYEGFRLITNSHSSTRMWGNYLGVPARDIAVMYPFADEAFSKQPAPVRRPGPTRVLFAGRLTVEKGFYTFLEALHYFVGDPNFEFSITTAGNKETYFFKDQKQIIEKLARAHPMLNVIPTRTTPQAMAELLVSQDIVVMPSHGLLWPEPFGMLSVEAQRCGCRVVASAVGGLAETNCGGLHLFEADNSMAFAAAIRRAAKLGRLSTTQRRLASQKFTVAQSVDQLLDILHAKEPLYYMPHPREHASLR